MLIELIQSFSSCTTKKIPCSWQYWSDCIVEAGLLRFWREVALRGLVGFDEERINLNPKDISTFHSLSCQSCPSSFYPCHFSLHLMSSSLELEQHRVLMDLHFLHQLQEEMSMNLLLRCQETGRKSTTFRHDDILLLYLPLHLALLCSDGQICISCARSMFQHRMFQQNAILTTILPIFLLFLFSNFFRQFSFEKLPTPLKSNSQMTALKFVAFSRKVQKLAELHSVEDLTRITGTLLFLYST